MYDYSKISNKKKKLWNIFFKLYGRKTRFSWDLTLNYCLSASYRLPTISEHKVNSKTTCEIARPNANLRSWFEIMTSYRTSWCKLIIYHVRFPNAENNSSSLWIAPSPVRIPRSSWNIELNRIDRQVLSVNWKQERLFLEASRNGEPVEMGGQGHAKPTQLYK